MPHTWMVTIRLLVVVVPVFVDLRPKSAGVRRGSWAWLLGWLPAYARSELVTAAPITDCAGFSLAPTGSHGLRWSTWDY